MTAIAQFYGNCLSRHPLVTKCVTTSTLLGLSDINCQFIRLKLDQSKGENINTSFMSGYWNPGHTGAMMLYGLFVSGPSQHMWLTRVVHNVIKERTWKATIKKVALDFSVGSLVMMPMFFLGINLIEGKSLEDATGKLQQEWPAVFKLSVRIWPAFQMLNFMFVPIPYQQLAINCTAFFWNSFLSYVQHYG